MSKRLLLLLLVGGCFRHTYYLSDTPAIVPIVAEPRASMMKVVAGTFGPYAFQENPGSTNIGMDLSVGKEIAIYTTSDAVQDQVPLSPKQQLFGVWFPVSFHMLWDLSDSSKAIINTDYRFGGMVKYVHGVNWGGFVHEAGLRLTPLMHESTHLGDELTIAGKRRNPTTFERINPSQYFMEALFTLHHFEDRVGKRQNQTFLRGGADYSWTSLYGSDVTETRGGRTIAGARARWQPILQIEHVFGAMNSGGGGPSPTRFEPFISADVRHRIVFDYEKLRTSDPDRRALSTNVLIGGRRADRVTRKGVSDFYVRLYYGVNPHGQFRNDPHFWLAGFGLALDP